MHTFAYCCVLFCLGTDRFYPQSYVIVSLQWRHNERDGVSNYQSHDCLHNSLFRRRSKKTSKLRVTGLCAGNSPMTGEFPAQRASNAENVSIGDVIMTGNFMSAPGPVRQLLRTWINNSKVIFPTENNQQHTWVRTQHLQINTHCIFCWWSPELPERTRGRLWGRLRVRIRSIEKTWSWKFYPAAQNFTNRMLFWNTHIFQTI